MQIGSNPVAYLNQRLEALRRQDTPVTEPQPPTFQDGMEEFQRHFDLIANAPPTPHLVQAGNRSVENVGTLMQTVEGCFLAITPFGMGPSLAMYCYDRNKQTVEVNRMTEDEGLREKYTLHLADGTVSDFARVPCQHWTTRAKQPFLSIDNPTSSWPGPLPGSGPLDRRTPGVTNYSDLQLPAFPSSRI